MNFPFESIGGRRWITRGLDFFGGSFDDVFERSFRRGVFEERTEGANQFTSVLFGQVNFLLLQDQRRFMVFHVSNKFDSRQVLLDAAGPVQSPFEHPDDLGLQPFLRFLYYCRRDPLLALAL